MHHEIFSHKGTSPASDELSIHAVDEQGQSGANHLYKISSDKLDLLKNPSSSSIKSTEEENEGPINGVYILFQNGPIKEADVNGVTEQSLLAIVIDRLQSFQKGPFACRENALAVTKLEEAMHWLGARTRDRIARGVEGTNVT